MNIREVAAAVAACPGVTVESREIRSAHDASVALEGLAEALLYSPHAAAVVAAVGGRRGALLDLVARATQREVDAARCALGLVSLAEVVVPVALERAWPFVERFLVKCRPHLRSALATDGVCRAVRRIFAAFPAASGALAPLEAHDTFASLVALGRSSPAVARLCRDLVGLDDDDDDDDDEDYYYSEEEEFSKEGTLAGAEDEVVLCSGEFAEVCGVALLAGPGRASAPSRAAEMVGATRRNARALAEALEADNRPIVVRGPRGGGKSAVIREVARRCRVRLVELVLDEAADARSLAGFHELGANGEFRWREGPVAKAARAGDWVVIEDVETAPAEVLALLKPLCRDGVLGAPGRRCAGDSAVARPSFRLVATTTDETRHFFLGADSWRVVEFEPLGDDDVFELAKARAPRLPSSLAAAALVAARGEGRGARDVLKVAARLSDFAFAADRSYVPEAARFAAGIEVFEVCAASSRDPDAELRAAEAIAAAFEVDPVALAARVCLDGPDEAAPALSASHVGRVPVPGLLLASNHHQTLFAPTPRSCRLLERVAACAAASEPCLLVGEPGCGKTSCVQRLAEACGKELRVLNLSHATDADELLGGVRPVSAAETARSLFDETRRLFEETFPASANAAYLDKLSRAFAAGKWATFARGVRHAAAAAAAAAADEKASPKRKRRGGEKEERRRPEWAALVARASELEKRPAGNAKIAFAFVESALATAAREGAWVLLDEINLAPSDVLERLAPLLDGEIWDAEDRRVPAHSGFRAFAAMNPSDNNSGKRELPPAVRSRFTELFVREPTRDSDLAAIAAARLAPLSASALATRAVALHRVLVASTNSSVFVDGAGAAPRYSLRTFCRALDAARALAPTKAASSSKRVVVSLREGFELAYATQLQGDGPNGGRRAAGRAIASELGVPARPVGAPDEFSPSAPDAVATSRRPADAVATSRRPADAVATSRRPADAVALVAKNFWLPAGPRDRRVDWSTSSRGDRVYVLTPTSRRSLRRVARACAFGAAPILLEGPTCAGKTSLVEFLAAKVGMRCARLNNHEHTDVSEYVGRYAPRADGSVTWVDGALATALRRGEWILLDELNLAPGEVLEALNRLLDHNRELRIPETNEVVSPAPGFRLFATQNPATYAGRKPLSRAFRDRFVEIHVDELPTDELVSVVCRSASGLPASLATKLVDAHAALRRLGVVRGRDGGALFEGRLALSTSRDVLKWAKRCANFESSQQQQEVVSFIGVGDRERHALSHGRALLVERLRSEEERRVVSDRLRRAVCPALDDADDEDYAELPRSRRSSTPSSSFEAAASKCGVAPTRALARLVSLAGAAVDASEPVLLVGETGGGKTTAVQVVAAARGADLETINCHMHSEAADFLGALRPVRCRRRGENEESKKGDDDDVAVAFEWIDGALVAAMRRGAWVLLDELNLADDAVIERLNSLLEPGRTITLAEKGGDRLEEVVAAPSFRVFATMNPGGDHGKRELSPALRSRFTEIWVPTLSRRADKEALVLAALGGGLDDAAAVILDFEAWCRGEEEEEEEEEKNNNTPRGPARVPPLTARDLRAWAHFSRAALASVGGRRWAALGHGCALACLDGLALANGGADREACQAARLRAEDALLKIAASKTKAEEEEEDLDALREALRWDLDGPPPERAADRYGAAPFFVPAEILPDCCCCFSGESFCASAPTTAANFRRVLRACALPRAVLLEGPPGVGKSALVAQLAARSGRVLSRVNLSEHADISDLVGADLPDSSGGFEWRDGPLLAAVKAGDWILLDELNLAPQPVLEGLNACLDHRAELFVPELGRAFACEPGFRLFATQNSVADGAGRRALPRSFLDRFTRVSVSSLGEADLVAIATAKRGIDAATAARAAAAVVSLRRQPDFAAGADVNARDLERWCGVAASEGPDRASLAVFAPRCRDAPQRAALDAVLAERGMATDEEVAVVSTPEYALAGAVALPRRGAFVAPVISSSDDDDEEQASSPPSRRAAAVISRPVDGLALEACARALRERWPLLLVGDDAADVAETLARVSGAKLWRLQLSPATDVADLLGGYEQIDAARLARRASARSRAAVAATRRLVVEGKADLDALLLRLSLSSDEFFEKDNGVLPPEIERVVELARGARAAATTTDGPPPFRLVDGPVVSAARRGVWLFLEDANLCAPAVLDRLNSLLEPNGSLALGEGGLVTPKPAFRVILGIDPRRGELSRALRNRCVEVSVARKPTTTLKRWGVEKKKKRRFYDDAAKLVCLDPSSSDRVAYAATQAFALRVVVVGGRASAARRALVRVGASDAALATFDTILARAARSPAPVELAARVAALWRALTTYDDDENDLVDQHERCLAECDARAALDALPRTAAVGEVPVEARRAVFGRGARAAWYAAARAAAAVAATVVPVATHPDPAVSDVLAAVDDLLDACVHQALARRREEEEEDDDDIRALDDLGARRDALAMSSDLTVAPLTARRCRDLRDCAERAVKTCGGGCGGDLARLTVALERLAPPSAWRCGDHDVLWRYVARGGWPRRAEDVDCVARLRDHADALAWPRDDEREDVVISSSSSGRGSFAARLAALVTARGDVATRTEAAEALATALAPRAGKLQVAMRASPARLRGDVDAAVAAAAEQWEAATLDLSFDAFAEESDEVQHLEGQRVTVWARDELFFSKENGPTLLDRWAFLQVAPVTEVALARDELAALAALSAKSDDDFAYDAISRVLVRDTARSPGDAAPYALLGWLAEAGEDVEIAARRCLPGMLARWVDRLWHVGVRSGDNDCRDDDVDDHDEFALVAPKDDAGPASARTGLRKLGPRGVATLLGPAMTEAARRLVRSPTPIFAVCARRRQVAAAIARLKRGSAVDPRGPLRMLLAAHVDSTLSLEAIDARAVPALAAARDIASKRDLTLADSGYAWALLGAARLVLAAPGSREALDPTLVARAERRSRADLEQIIADRAAVAAGEARRASVRETPALRHLLARRAELEIAATEDVVLDIERPPTAPPFSEFCSMTLDFTTSLGTLERVRGLADALRRGTGIAEARSWQMAASRFSQRVERCHGGARPDVVEPLIAAVAAARLGLGLLEFALVAEPPQKQVLEYPFVQVPGGSKTDLLTVVLQCELALCVGSGGDDGSEEEETVHRGVRAMAATWREADESARRDDTTRATSGFALRGRSNDDNNKNPEEDDDDSNVVPKLLEACVGIFVRATLGVELFSRRALASAVRRAALVEAASQCAFDDHKSAAGLCVVLADTLGPELRREARELFETPSNMDEAARDAAPLARLGLVAPDAPPTLRVDVHARLEVSALLSRLRELLLRWPANATLERAARVADALIRSETSTKPTQILAGLEIVLRRAQDWQEHCAREFSLEAQLAPLRAVVSKGRKAELEKWATLLAERETCAAQSPAVLRAMPRLDAIVARGPPTASHGGPRWLLSGGDAAAAADDDAYAPLETFAALDDFVRLATIGDFGSRLALLRSFAKVADTPHALCLEGLSDFYAQFSGAVATARAAAREPIQKALADEQRLARWDDRNFHALADCGEKSRRKLAKLAREYDEALAAPVEAVLSRAMAVPDDAQGAVVHATLFPHAAAAADPLSPQKSPRQQRTPLDAEVPGSRYASRLAGLARRMTTFFERCPPPPRAEMDESPAEEITSAIFGRIASFRANDKVPRSARRRAVLDLIKGMRELGRVEVAPEAGEPRTSSCAAKRPPPIEEADFSALGGARDYARRGGAELGCLRREEPQKTRDVTPGEAAALRQLCERLSVVTLEQRARLAASLAERRRFVRLLDGLETLREARPLLRRGAEAVAELRSVAVAVEAKESAARLRDVETGLWDARDVAALVAAAATIRAERASDVGGARDRVAAFLEKLAEARDEQRPPSDDAAAAITFDAAVEAVLATAQNLLFRDDEGNKPKTTTLSTLHGRTLRRLAALGAGLGRAATTFEALDRALDRRNDAARRGVASLASVLLSGVDGFVSEAASLHRATAKLFYVVCRVARTLFAVGLCGKEDDDEKGDSGRTDECEGTGMGDGEFADGSKDVSNEITNEEQLLGTRRGDEGEEDDEAGDGKAEEAVDRDAPEGVEMEAAFDGETRDVERDDERPDDDDDEEDDGEDEESVDRELGEAGDAAQAVDERLWNEEDVENDGEPPVQASRADGAAGKLEDEIRGKEDDAAEEAQPAAERNKGNDQASSPAIEEEAAEEPAPGRSKQRDQAAEEMDVDPAEENAAQEGAHPDEVNGGDHNLPENMEIDEVNGEEVEEVEEEVNGEEVEEEEVGSVVDEDGGGEATRDDRLEETTTPPPAETEISAMAHGETALESFGTRTERAGEAYGAATAQGADAVQGADGEDGGADGAEAGEEDRGEGGGGAAEERRAPNPYRDAGDALRHWHRRLDIADRDEAEEIGPRLEDKDDALDGEADESYEYARQDERASAQALGGVGDDAPPLEAPASDEEQSQPERAASPDAAAERDDVKDHHREPPPRDARASRRKRKEEAPPALRGVEKREDEERPDDGVRSRVVFSTTTTTPVLLEEEEEDDDEKTSCRRAVAVGDDEGGEDAAWREHVDRAAPVARRLCESLRSVLAPTIASRLRGDYRTGKRLSMRRVLDYVASGYRRDKIWMRRTKPAKRAYQILVAIDDSRSMKSSGADAAALTALAALSTAFAQLEAGELAVAAFGDDVRLLHEFCDGPFQGAAARRAAGRFGFDQQATNAVALLEAALPVLRDARDARSRRQCLQLVVVISDGRFDSGSRAALRRLHRDAVGDGVAIVLLLLDRPGRDSVLEMKLVSFDEGRVQTAPYLEDFPFSCFVLLRDVAALPETLALALKQWFECHAAPPR
ncbi:hypothetical protein CTAYLR_001228 [Chrysophaeum taylorii]|uniref:Midasin n=1 Tax=Chrysophaeum taylorii TaxID=2483200 RepID=A0AAD7UDC1_9STRA|nr:hypothetical protein CTAYLR_001228 [Chrysophaeum taylorii]